MATVKVWFHAEAHYLEVQFHQDMGLMKETAHEAVMERVDATGRLLGSSILGVSRFTAERPLEAKLDVA